MLYFVQVAGCPDIERPPHTSYKRQGDVAVVGCEHNDEEWRLTCIGNQWEGSIGNCTQKVQGTYIKEHEQWY